MLKGFVNDYVIFDMFQLCVIIWDIIVFCFKDIVVYGGSF